MDSEQFRKDKKIDPGQLDIECIQQAERAYHWAQASIEAGFDEERAKFRLNLIENQLEHRCRRRPEDFGLSKVTDAGVKSAVRINTKYVAAYDQWLEARRRNKLLDAAVKAMVDKKHMLQGLITLHGQQYFAGPSVPRDLVAAWVEQQRETSERVNQLQRKRTRKRRRS